MVVFFISPSPRPSPNGRGKKRTRPVVVKNIVGVGSKPTHVYNHARKNIRRGRRPRRPVSNPSLTLALSQRARGKADVSRIESPLTLTLSQRARGKTDASPTSCSEFSPHPDPLPTGEGKTDVSRFELFPHPDPLSTGEGKTDVSRIESSLTLTLSQRAREI